VGAHPGIPPLGERIAAVAALDPAAPALEFEGRWRTWGEVGATIDAVARVVAHPGAAVGVLLRNRPAQVATVLGVLRAGGCLVTINPARGVERTREDLAALDLALLAGSSEDLAALAPDPAPPLLAVDDVGEAVVSRPAPPDRHAEGPDRHADRHAEGPDRRGRTDRPGVAVRMLTSGTTGPPKRVDLTYETLERVLLGAKYYERNRAPELRLRSGVAIVNSPMVHLGGIFRVLQCVNDGRSFALLERFTVEGWVDAVRRHRPQTASLVPAALRMVLAADVEPDALSSIRSVVSGTAPLSPDDADAFTARYGIPVLVSFAATEFGGAVAGWNLADHERFWATKKGSVGRAHPGSELRVVDADDGRPLGPDEEGLLEVKTSHLGDDAGWVRTTDRARIDGDGFVWILGRADQAIIRGGFKVHPEDVRAALERHPGVWGAAVVGRPDRRLGAVPVAAVELRPGAEPVTADALASHASASLTRYEVPAEIRIVDALPRTESAKVDLAAVRALFEDPSAPAPDAAAGV
jgi:acyl-CoA synthetase (AMP-forming)/AMP-acid ligase II